MSYCLASSEFVHDLHRSQEGEQRLRCLRIDGALPDIAGVQSGEYELSIPIVLITRNSPAVGSALFNMIGFYHSERGEKLLHALCLVPLTQYNLCE
jgi:ABC-type phosphate transport system substrate-binding protein